MDFKTDDLVKVVAVNGNYRYGYISRALDRGYALLVSFEQEGESKIAYDAARMALLGEEIIDWNTHLTPTERRLIPLVAAGLTTAQIAHQFQTKPVTITTQLRQLRLKLQLENRHQLKAYCQGLKNKLGPT